MFQNDRHDVIVDLLGAQQPQAPGSEQQRPVAGSSDLLADLRSQLGA